MAWATSNRRAELPRNWATLRQQVKRRARGQCQAGEHAAGCDGIGNECDHIGDKRDHSLANLQWLSAACHRAKTQTEARAASHAARRWRPPPRHPSA